MITHIPNQTLHLNIVIFILISQSNKDMVKQIFLILLVLRILVQFLYFLVFFVLQRVQFSLYYLYSWNFKMFLLQPYELLLVISSEIIFKQKKVIFQIQESYLLINLTFPIKNCLANSTAANHPLSQRIGLPFVLTSK